MPCLCQRDDCGKIQVSLQGQSADSKTKSKHFLSAWNSCWVYIRLFLSSPFLPGCRERSRFTHPPPRPAVWSLFTWRSSQGLYNGPPSRSHPARAWRVLSLHTAFLSGPGESPSSQAQNPCSDPCRISPQHRILVSCQGAAVIPGLE